MANDTNTKTHAAVLERMRDELLREADRLDTTPHMTGGYAREKAEAIQSGIEALTEVAEYRGVEGRCSKGHNKRFSFELDGQSGCVACEKEEALRAAERYEAALRGALTWLGSDSIRDNKHRMGALPSQDVDYALKFIREALEAK